MTECKAVGRRQGDYQCTLPQSHTGEHRYQVDYNRLNALQNEHGVQLVDPREQKHREHIKERREKDGDHWFVGEVEADTEKPGDDVCPTCRGEGTVSVTTSVVEIVCPTCASAPPETGPIREPTEAMVVAVADQLLTECPTTRFWADRQREQAAARLIGAAGATLAPPETGPMRSLTPAEQKSFNAITAKRNKPILCAKCKESTGPVALMHYGVCDSACQPDEEPVTDDVDEVTCILCLRRMAAESLEMMVKIDELLETSIVAPTDEMVEAAKALVKEMTVYTLNPFRPTYCEYCEEALTGEDIHDCVVCRLRAALKEAG